MLEAPTPSPPAIRGTLWTWDYDDRRVVRYGLHRSTRFWLPITGDVRRQGMAWTTNNPAELRRSPVDRTQVSEMPRSVSSGTPFRRRQPEPWGRDRRRPERCAPRIGSSQEAPPSQRPPPEGTAT